MSLRKAYGAGHLDFKNKYPESIWLSKENYTVYYTNGEGYPLYIGAEKYCDTLCPVEVFFHDSGMIATHNYPCPVCKTKHAVFVSHKGHFEPCVGCQAAGWSIIKKKDKSWYEFWK